MGKLKRKPGARSKLTGDQKLALIEMAEEVDDSDGRSPKYTYEAIAAKFEVSISTVCNILKGVE